MTRVQLFLAHFEVNAVCGDYQKSLWINRLSNTVGKGGRSLCFGHASLGAIKGLVTSGLRRPPRRLPGTSALSKNITDNMRLLIELFGRSKRSFVVPG